MLHCNTSIRKFCFVIESLVKESECSTDVKICEMQYFNDLFYIGATTERCVKVISSLALKNEQSRHVLFSLLSPGCLKRFTSVLKATL